MHFTGSPRVLNDPQIFIDKFIWGLFRPHWKSSNSNKTESNSFRDFTLNKDYNPESDLSSVIPPVFRIKERPWRVLNITATEFPCPVLNFLRTSPRLALEDARQRFDGAEVAKGERGRTSYLYHRMQRDFFYQVIFERAWNTLQCRTTATTRVAVLNRAVRNLRHQETVNQYRNMHVNAI